VQKCVAKLICAADTVDSETAQETIHRSAV